MFKFMQTLFALLLCLLPGLVGCGAMQTRQGHPMWNSDAVRYDALAYHVMGYKESVLQGERTSVTRDKLLSKSEQQEARTSLQNELKLVKDAKREYQRRLNEQRRKYPHLVGTIPAFSPEYIQQKFGIVPPCCARGDHGPPGH